MPPCSWTQSCSELGAVLADVGLGRARPARPASGAPAADGRGGGVADRVARLEPRLHVGEAVLERLVRGQRPAERVPVERPLDGHVERGLHGADRLGVARARGRSWSWRSTSVVGLADLADHGVGRHAHVVEGDRGEPAGQVDGAHRRDRDARRRRRARAPGSGRRRCGRSTSRWLGLGRPTRPGA